LTSWDDGHPCDLRVADLLARYGLAGTFFVPGKNREGLPVLGAADLRILDQGFEIGGHTLTHRYLARDLGKGIISSEIIEGKRLIEDRLGHTITGFCYPGGRFNDVVVQSVKTAGFGYARTIENLRSDLGNDCWQVPTTLQFFPHSAAVLVKNALRYPAALKFPLLLQRMRKKDFVSFVMQCAEFCAKSQGVFHLWGHSWEINQHHLWPSLETVFRRLAGLTSKTVTLAEAISEKFSERGHP